MEQQLINHHGDAWIVEHRESNRLTHIGGFLMTYGSQGCITLSAGLDGTDKARGRAVLLGQLAEMSVGASHTILWHPDNM